MPPKRTKEEFCWLIYPNGKSLLYLKVVQHASLTASTGTEVTVNVFWPGVGLAALRGNNVTKSPELPLACNIKVEEMNISKTGVCSLRIIHINLSIPPFLLALCNFDFSLFESALIPDKEHCIILSSAI